MKCKIQDLANNSTSPRYSTKTRRYGKYSCMNLWKKTPIRLRLDLGYKALIFASTTNLKSGPRFWRVVYLLWQPGFSFFFQLMFILSYGNLVTCVCRFLREKADFFGIKHSTSVWVQTQKSRLYCLILLQISWFFLAFCSFLPWKMLKMTFLTSFWNAQHPNAGPNIQQWKFPTCSSENILCFVSKKFWFYFSIKCSSWTIKVLSVETCKKEMSFVKNWEECVCLSFQIQKNHKFFVDARQ